MAEQKSKSKLALGRGLGRSVGRELLWEFSLWLDLYLSGSIAVHEHAYVLLSRASFP
jgi:hypothetical protein